MQDDELHTEDLDAGRARRHHLLPLVRRLWHAWHTPHQPPGRTITARVAAAGLTVVLALTLVAMTGDTRAQSTSHVALGADPIPVTTSKALPQVMLAGQPPTPVGTSDWQQVALPNTPGTSVRSMVPSPTDPSTLYACTGFAVDSPGQAALGPIVVWRTRDAGQHWISLPLPPIESDWCELQLAADGSSRMTLVTGNSPYATVFLSDDAGNSWMQITAPPFDKATTTSQRIVWATAHHVYCWYSYLAYVSVATWTSNNGGFGSSSESHWAYAFYRSDDDGRTWRRDDVGLPVSPEDEGLVFQTHDENHLLSRVYRQAGSDWHAELWETFDAGNTWHAASTVNDFLGLFVVPTAGGSVVAAGLPDYIMRDEQVPSDLYRLGVLARQADGSWQLLPPLPVPGAKTSRTGLLQVYQETNDGRMLTFGVAPDGSVPSADDKSVWNGTSSQWLWIWDPRVGRWLSWPSPLPFSYRWGCGVCLENSATWITTGATPGTYLWLRDSFGQLGGYNVAYRVFIPDAPPGQLDAPA